MKNFLTPGFAVLVFIVLGACSSPGVAYRAGDKAPAYIAHLVSEDLLARPGFMMYDWDGVRAVHYAEVCAAFGAARLAGMQGDSATINRIAARYMAVIEDSIVNTANHVDANVYGILPLELFMHTGDSVFYHQGMELALGQWADPGPDGLSRQSRYWIDDVYMIGSLQVQAYRVSGDERFLNRAAISLHAYLDKLQQDNGLFHHGENAPFFWGRGNGWVAAGLAEVLSDLPPEHELYPALESGYKKMMEALLRYQCEDGMWRQLIDHDSAWKETSCTGMFGYAFSVGVNKGILKEEEYQAASRKAWMALTEYISADGLVSNVCVGTGQSQDVNYYLERPSVAGDFHGQAPVLWFAHSLLSQ